MTLHLIITTEPDRVEEAFSVRRKVFIDEQKVPEEIELDQYDWQMTTRHVLLLNELEEAVGTARFRPYQENILKVERVAVLRHLRKSGAGRMILEAIIQEAQKTGYKYIKLDAQVQAKGFYEQLDFEAEGKEFLEAGIKHIRMIKKLGGVRNGQ